MVIAMTLEQLKKELEFLARNSANTVNGCDIKNWLKVLDNVVQVIGPSDKYPRLSDGVLVYPGMTVYSNKLLNEIEYTVLSFSNNLVETCYSLNNASPRNLVYIDFLSRFVSTKPKPQPKPRTKEEVIKYCAYTLSKHFPEDEVVRGLVEMCDEVLKPQTTKVEIFTCTNCGSHGYLEYGNCRKCTRCNRINLPPYE